MTRGALKKISGGIEEVTLKDGSRVDNLNFEDDTETTNKRRTETTYNSKTLVDEGIWSLF